MDAYKSLAAGGTFTAIILALTSFSVAVLPPYIKVCKHDDPEINKCINNSIEILRPQLAKGIPELNVPPLEPLPLANVALKRGPQAAQVDAKFTNLKVYGPSTFVITSLKSNLKKNRFDAKATLPFLHFEGKYEMDMSILVLKLHGKGDVRGNFTDYSFDLRMKGHKINRDGEDYLEFERLRIRLNVGKADLYLDKLFNGDPILGPATNNVINENSEAVLHELKPALEASLEDVFTDIANKITLRFTYKELFP